MTPLNLITEPYDRQARLYPALVLIAPAVASVVAIASAKISGLESLGVALAGIGGSFLLTELARDAGKKGEPWLFKQWGGMPSVAIFRHADARLDSITKARYHKRLATLVRDAKAPTVAEEQANPDAADKVYEAWSHYLRTSTRDTKKFPLLFKENVSYGYRRNVWGLRALGLGLSALSALGAGVRLYFGYHTNAKLDEAVLAALAFSLVFLALWSLRFTPSWVRIPADAYSARLAEAVEPVTAKPVAAKKKKG